MDNIDVFVDLLTLDFPFRETLDILYADSAGVSTSRLINQDNRKKYYV